MPSLRTQNISALWFVVVNSTVGFIDVKNPAIGAVVKHAGKQVSYVQKYVIVIYSRNTLISLSDQLV